MHLIRLDSNPNPNPDEWPDDHCQTEHRIEKTEDESFPDDARARVYFRRFGRGEKRRPSFAVEVNWIDVRALVRAFIEMEHSEALHLQEILQLAKAVESAGWTNDAPDDDFWDILPQSG